MDTNTQTQNPAQTQQQTPILAWEATTVPTHDRSKSWYLTAGIIFLGLVIHSIWTGSWSFAIVLGLLAAVYSIVHRKETIPRRMEFWRSGFHFAGTYTAWNECEGYWMLQGPNYIELHIGKKTGKPREVIIQTGPISADEIRLALEGILPELSNRIERPIDTLIRILKI